MEDLMKQKKVIKGKNTRIIKIIDSFTIEKLTLEVVDVNLEELNALIKGTNVLCDEILMACNDEEFDNLEKEMHDELDRLTSSKAKLLAFRVKLVPVVNVQALQYEQIQQSGEQQAREPENNVNLPKLNLPSFSGNVVEWISFCDLFTASIHNNKTLSDAQKLQYLKLSLKNDAAFLIQSLQISDANYSKAWDVLKERYENNSEIITATLDKLFSQQNLRQESAQGLRSLIDTSTQCLETLRILKEPVDHWDSIVIHFLKKKLDHDTLKVWMLETSDGKARTFKEFKTFLTQRANALASINDRRPPFDRKVAQWQGHKDVNKATALVASAKSCFYCNNSNCVLETCKEFLALSKNHKWDFIKKNKLCANCFVPGHWSRSCREEKCSKCGLPHNVVLHENRNSHKENEELEQRVDIISNSAASTIVHSSTSSTIKQKVLLPTAIINVYDSDGFPHSCRALIDTASEATFVKESLLNKLNLNRNRVSVDISGVSSSNVCSVKGSVTLGMSSKANVFQTFECDALILPKITCDLPQHDIDKKVLNDFKNLKLADPNCCKTGPIEVLLGVNILDKVLLSGVLLSVDVPGQNLVAQETTFGWVIFGKTNQPCENNKNNQMIVSNHACCHITYGVDKFEKFDTTLVSKSNECEEPFPKMCSKNSTKELVVKLPLQDPVVNKIVSAPNNDKCHDLKLEKGFSKEYELDRAYQKFLNECRMFGQMEPVLQNDLDKSDKETVPFPQFAKPNENKSRIVFVSDVKSSTDISLNYSPLGGPQLQNDLTLLLSRFTFHDKVLTTDSPKIYRPGHTQPWKDSKGNLFQHRRLFTGTPSTHIQRFVETSQMTGLALQSLSIWVLVDLAFCKFESALDLDHSLTMSNTSIRSALVFISYVVCPGVNLEKSYMLAMSFSAVDILQQFTTVVGMCAVDSNNEVQLTLLSFNTCDSSPKTTSNTIMKLCGALLLANLTNLASKALSVLRSNRKRLCVLMIVQLWIVVQPHSCKMLIVNTVSIALRLEFGAVVNSIQRQKTIACSSKLLSLNPFLDSHGLLLRVGGRLWYSQLTFGGKQPILLPRHCAFSELSNRQFHLLLLDHELVQSSLRDQSGRIAARDAIRHHFSSYVPVSKC